MNRGEPAPKFSLDELAFASWGNIHPHSVCVRCQRCHDLFKPSCMLNAELLISASAPE